MSLREMTAKQIMDRSRWLWESRQKTQTETLVRPEPEVFARPAAAAEIPRGAKGIIKLADEVTVTYARGPVKRTQPVRWETADSVLVRGTKGQRRFSAVWIDRKYEVGFAHGVGKVSSTQLKWYLTEDVGIPWLPGYDCLTRH